MRVADLFLYEATEDFWESGDDETKLISCVIKIMTVIELLLKEELESISPLLVLDRIDPVDLSEIANFSDRLINASQENSQDRKKVTARFFDILSRARKFIEITNEEMESMKFLYGIRNDLSHDPQSRQANDLEINRNLTDIIFPFLKKLLMRMQPEGLSVRGRRWIAVGADNLLWEKLSSLKDKRELELALLKKLEHFKKKYDARSESPEPLEVISDEGLWCPACHQETLGHILGLDVDWNPDGVLENVYRRMKCQSCLIKLDQDEIHEIESNIKLWIPEEFRGNWRNLER